MKAPQETPLVAGTLFVGDLHLDTADHRRVDRFVEWCEAGAAGARRLVVLGDLFEYWIGDGQLAEPGATRAAAGLARLVDAGCPVDLIPGNRDFLVGERFSAATGVRRLPAGTVGVLPTGERVLVLHGDELCTRDVAYQRLRRVLRSVPVTWIGRHLPAPVAHAVAGRLRRASRQAVAAKPSEEKALQLSAASAFLAGTDCRTLICGHVHEHRDEALPGGARLLVVDAFGGALDGIRVGPDGGLEAVSVGAPRAPAT